MKTVWFVLMDAVKGDPVWDTFCGIFADHNTALAHAEFTWNRLTDREQRSRIVTVNHANVDVNVPLEEAYDAICERGDGWYVDNEFTSN